MRYGFKEFKDVKENFSVEEVKNLEICKELRGYTILIKYKIISGEFKGYYIGEEYSGLPHPFLIIPSDKVV